MTNGKRPLPEGWRWARMGEACEINPRRPPELSSADSEPVTFVPMRAVDETEGTITRPEVRPFRDVRKGYTYFAENDVLFAKITPCMQNGKHAIARALLGGFGFGTTEFHVLRPGRAVTPEWIHFFIRQPEVLENAKAYFTGAVGQQRVPEAYLASLEIPLPPLADQRRIAAVLNEQMTAVEWARASAEARLEAAITLPTAYLRTVFDRPEAGRWRRRLLSEMSEICGGIQKTPDRKPTSFHRPYLTVRNVQRGFLDLSQVERFEVTHVELSRLCLQNGDILIVEGNGSLDHIGRNALFARDEEWIHQNHIIRVRLSREVCLPEFVSRFLNSDQGRKQMIEKAKTTSGLYTLSAGKVGSLEVPAPPVPEQQRIAAMLDEKTGSAERTRETIQEELDAISKLPAALLRRAFSREA